MASRCWVPVASGPLARYATGYGAWLAARGYSRWTIAHRLWQLELLSRWLECEGFSPGELTPARLEAFLAARRAAGYSSWVSARSTTLPLEYLRELGVVPLSASTVDGPLERLVADFGRYLLDERGLTEGTVEHYGPAARLFLTSRVGAELGGLERLSGADVSLFLAAECPKRGVAAARTVTCGLRSLLGWLYLTGRIADPLVWAVPAVAGGRWRALFLAVGLNTRAERLALIARLRDPHERARSPTPPERHTSTPQLRTFFIDPVRRELCCSGKDSLEYHAAVKAVVACADIEHRRESATPWEAALTKGDYYPEP